MLCGGRIRVHILSRDVSCLAATLASESTTDCNVHRIKICYDEDYDDLSEGG